MFIRVYHFILKQQQILMIQSQQKKGFIFRGLLESFNLQHLWDKVEINNFGEIFFFHSTVWHMLQLVDIIQAILFN